MEIQQKDNETHAAYIHCFKTSAKWCVLDDTAVICIFVKGLLDVHTTTANIFKKDPKTLSEVIRLVEILNAAQQLTATLTPSMVSMMSNDDRCFVCGQTVHFGHHCPSAQCYSRYEFGYFAQDCLNKILSSGIPCHQDRSHSRHWYTHNGRDRSHSTHYGYRHDRHFNQHFKRHTLPPHPATTSAHAALQQMDIPIATHAMTHPTGIVTPHATFTTSTNITHATIPWTRASLTPATLTTLHRKPSQWGKPSHAQDLQPPIPPTIPRLSPSKTPNQILPSYSDNDWFFKLLEPSSDEDE